MIILLALYLIMANLLNFRLMFMVKSLPFKTYRSLSVEELEVHIKRTQFVTRASIFIIVTTVLFFVIFIVSLL